MRGTSRWQPTVLALVRAAARLRTREMMTAVDFTMVQTSGNFREIVKFYQPTFLISIGMPFFLASSARWSMSRVPLLPGKARTRSGFSSSISA